MKSLIPLCLVFLFAAASQNLSAASVGLSLHAPKGVALTIKQRIFGGSAIEGGFGRLIGQEFTANMIQAHYISQRSSRVWYYGLGARIANYEFNPTSNESNYTGYTLRAPFGLHTSFRRVEYFGETSLMLNFTSDNVLGFDFAIGARYRL